MKTLDRVKVAGLPRPRSAKAIGIVVLAVLVAFGVGAFEKERLASMLSSGESLQAEFPRNHHLVVYDSEVKMGGVALGTVTDVERTDYGTAKVSMEVEDGTLAKLGSDPSAAIRPALLVGGRNYVDLTPGGHTGEFEGGPIPLERTSVPVELDDVLSSFTPSAKEGVRTAVDKFDATLRRGGRDAVKDLLKAAPDTLRPTGKVLNAVRGTNQSTDLTRLVRGLETTGAVLSEQDGQLSDIIRSFHGTTSALASVRTPLAESIATSPETLRTARTGLSDLNGSLDRLTATANEFRPSVNELDSLLENLDPVVVEARPLVRDVRTLLHDADPLLDRLVPIAGKTTGVLRDINGPVLDRLSGPIRQTVLSPWKGHGVYEGGGNDNKFYEELGFLTVDGAKAFQTHDHNGSLGRLMAGVGGRTVGGSAVPMSIEQYLDMLGLSPSGPQEGSGPGGDMSRPETTQGGTR